MMLTVKGTVSDESDIDSIYIDCFIWFVNGVYEFY